MDNPEFNANWRLAIVENIARNGRLFCSMLVAICIAAFLKYGDFLWLRFAILAALPVGLSCIVDVIGATRLGRALALCNYALAAFVVLFLLLAAYGR